MSTTTTFLGDAATPREITHYGKTYRAGRLTETRMEQFSAWLEKWTRDKLVSLYGHDQPTLAAKLDELEKDVLEGVYEFTEDLIMGKEKWKPETRIIDGKEVEGEARDVEGGVLHTQRGRVTLAAVLFGCSRDEALALILAHPAETGHLLNLALTESFPPAKDTFRAVVPNGQAAR